MMSAEEKRGKKEEERERCKGAPLPTGNKR